VKALTSRDFADLQRGVLALYSHRELGDFRRAVPGIFLKLIPADHFSLVDARLDPDSRTVRVLDVWESGPLAVGRALRALERNLFEHPFTQHVLKHGPNGALLLSDFYTLPQLRKT